MSLIFKTLPGVVVGLGYGVLIGGLLLLINGMAGGIVFTLWPQLKNELSGMTSWAGVSFVFLIFLVLFTIFPIGLAATAMAAVRVSGRFASR